MSKIFYNVPIMKVGENHSGRIYTQENLSSVVNQINNAIEERGAFLGFTGDNNEVGGECLNLGSVTHKITCATVKNDELCVTGEILDTPRGVKVQDIINRGESDFVFNPIFDNQMNLIAINATKK